MLELIDQLAALEDPLDQEPELVGVIGLGDEVVGAGLHGPSASVGSPKAVSTIMPTGSRSPRTRASRSSPLSSGIRRSVITRWYLRARSSSQADAAVGDGLDLEPVGFEDLAEVIAIEFLVVHGEDAAIHAA